MGKNATFMQKGSFGQKSTCIRLTKILAKPTKILDKKVRLNVPNWTTSLASLTNYACYDGKHNVLRLQLSHVKLPNIPREICSLFMLDLAI